MTAPDSASATPPQEPVIDDAVLAALREQLGATDVAAIVAMFVDAAPERSAALLAVHAAGDGVGVAALAHALRSSAALLGATRLTARTRTLQSAAEAGAAWRDLCVEVVDELDAAAARLAAELDTPRPAGE